ncbi:uncharacterized protein LOC143644312 isoform X2 [Tamandua tetradactyla]|uniref:uncharacterized protein LOC143644312 isoform X2 n=1 Tax=Tamandua tetradactyla TaxID=48850 RepID=UPI0040546EFC
MAEIGLPSADPGSDNLSPLKEDIHPQTVPDQTREGADTPSMWVPILGAVPVAADEKGSSECMEGPRHATSSMLRGWKRDGKRIQDALMTEHLPWSRKELEHSLGESSSKGGI